MFSLSLFYIAYGLKTNFKMLASIGWAEEWAGGWAESEEWADRWVEGEGKGVV